MLLTALLLAHAAQAQALTAAASGLLLSGDVVGNTVGVRPGLRLGYEPMSALGIEAAGDYGARGYTADAALTGRAWLVGEDTGIFLFGRGAIGFAGYDEQKIAPLFGFYGGFGGRPAPWLNLEASVGPEWIGGGARLRTEMTLGLVFALSGDSGTTSHRPIRRVH